MTSMVASVVTSVVTVMVFFIVVIVMSVVVGIMMRQAFQIMMSCDDLNVWLHVNSLPWVLLSE